MPMFTHKKGMSATTRITKSQKKNRPLAEFLHEH